ncbi:hypothetical protein J6590_013807 [Homalodisca vitripennis]|nr:hypothetical protein J6590_013807 [Homalodisca vitripennis]
MRDGPSRTIKKFVEGKCPPSPPPIKLIVEDEEAFNSCGGNSIWSQVRNKTDSLVICFSGIHPQPERGFAGPDAEWGTKPNKGR